jgi:hypothetical protein
MYSALLVSLLLTSLAFAQVDTATITGVITDPSGLVIAGARIRATNQATGVEHTTLTNEEGVYVLTALPIGIYDVEITDQGFQTVRRPNVTLNAGTRARVDVQMTVGQVTEVVEVKTAVPRLESETSSLSQVVENKLITQMPLNGRNYQDLAVLSAGVLPNRSQNFVTDGFSVNGAAHDQNVFQLDGADNNNYFSGIVVASNEAVKPNIDAIQEFKLETHNYSAEFGRGGGAVVQVTTRSGANQYHGTAFEFLRNDKLDANNFFNSGRLKPPFRQNQYGSTFGGPIRRDKMFFFGDYESTRIREKVTSQSAIPTPAEVAGNFNGVASISDPATQIAEGTRQPFPGNVIPASRMDPVAARMIALYPAPNLTGKLNYVFNSPRNTDNDKGDGRFDHQVDSNNSVFVRYTQLAFDRLEPGNLPLPASGGNTAVRLARAKTGVLSWTTVVPGATKVNEIRVAYNRLVGAIDSPTRTQLWKEFGFLGLFDRQDIKGLPSFQPSGYQSIGDRSYAPDPRKQDVRQFVDTFSWNKGKHAMKMGTNIRNYIRYSGITNFARGVFSFNGQFTRARAGSPTGGDAVADSLLGLTSSITFSTPVNVRRHAWSYEFYFQDNFKVSTRLTLNLGLRWEYQSPYTEQNNRVQNFVIDPASPNFGQLVPPTSGTEGRTFRKRDFDNWAPRIGFSYSLSSKTTIRGGYGIFYLGDFFLNATTSIYANPPFYLQTDITTASNASTSNIIIRDGIPADALNPKSLSGRSMFGAWYPYDYPIGMTNQWNIDIQRSLPGNAVLSAAYVGSNTVHMTFDADLNQPAPGPGPNNQRRFWPDYGNITTTAPLTGSNYQALELKVERRFEQGVSLLSGYTFSKTLAGQLPQRSTVLAPEKARSFQHMPHRWFTAGVWELPFARGRRYATGGVISHVVAGWQISPIFVVQSGLPVTPTVTGNPANTTGAQRPNRVGDGNLPRGERSPQRWFDVSAFTVPAPFTLGNSAAYVIEGPGRVNLNAAVARTLHLKERFSLDFRTEFFDLANNPHFDFPNTTVNTPSAGTIGSTTDPGRQIQFGLKLLF